MLCRLPDRGRESFPENETSACPAWAQAAAQILCRAAQEQLRDVDDPFQRTRATSAPPTSFPGRAQGLAEFRHRLDVELALKHAIAAFKVFRHDLLTDEFRSTG